MMKHDVTLVECFAFSLGEGQAPEMFFCAVPGQQLLFAKAPRQLALA